MITKEQEKIVKKLGISQQDLYSLFISKEFMKKHELTFWFKEDAPEGVVIKASNGKKEPHNLVIVYIFCRNGLELFTDGFFLPKPLQGQGIRTQCFAAQIKVAKKLGYKMLTSKCSRSDDRVEFGYIVGPLLGYNGLYNSVKVSILKEKYCKAHKINKAIKAKILKTKDILNLCAFKEGLECRKEIGRTFDAEFDLNDTSKSMKTFIKHFKKYK